MSAPSTPHRSLWIAFTVMVIMHGSHMSRAQTQTWDAYRDYHATGNTADATWQYLYNTAGVNGGYTRFPSFMVETNGGPAFPVWTANLPWHFVVQNPTLNTSVNGVNPIEMIVHPCDDYAATIGWKSPMNGTVEVNFSLSDRDWYVTSYNRGEDWDKLGWNDTCDGVKYWLFKSGEAAPLSHGTIADHGISGMITVPDIAVATGDMLYLQVGKLDNSFGDVTGVAFSVARTAGIINGGFETPSLGTGAASYRDGQPADGWALLPGGSSASGGGYVGNGSAYGNPNAPGGTQAGLLKGMGGMSQAVSGFDSAKEYRLSFYAAAPSSATSNPFQVRLNGVPLAFNGAKTIAPAGQYVLYTSDSFTPTGDTMTLSFVSTLTDERNLSSFIDNVQFSESLSHGRQVLLTRGNIVLETCTVLMGDAFSSVDRWLSANFDTFGLWGYTSARRDAAFAQLPTGALWSRLYDPNNSLWDILEPIPTYAVLEGQNPYVPTPARPYSDNLVRIQYSDEPTDLLTNAKRMPDMYYWFRAWNQLYPNALTCTNFWGDQYTAEQLTGYMRTTRPDMLMFDWYRPWVAWREPWYYALQLHRTVALAGYDGTGRYPIPYGQYLCMFRPSFSDPLPDECLVRLQRFASLTFGYTVLGGYVYNVKTGDGYASVMFSSPGDTSPSAVFKRIAEVNLQCQRLGPALIRLKSTDVRIIPAKDSDGAVWPLPTGLSAWSRGAGDSNCITSITPRGRANTATPSTYFDWLIGYFQPLKNNNSDYPYANGLHFMVCNGRDAGVASEQAEWARIEFDFTGTPFNKLQRLNRITGKPEIVNLTALGRNRYRLDLRLDGGTADLFRFYPQ